MKALISSHHTVIDAIDWLLEYLGGVKLQSIVYLDNMTIRGRATK